jgi:hypothetical protein
MGITVQHEPAKRIRRKVTREQAGIIISRYRAGDSISEIARGVSLPHYKVSEVVEDFRFQRAVKLGRIVVPFLPAAS